MLDKIVSPDLIGKIVQFGPPTIIVIATLMIVRRGLRNRDRISHTIVYALILVTFFVLWMVALPRLQPRYVVLTVPISATAFRDSYSLKPIRVRTLDDPEFRDLDDSEITIPSSGERLNIRFQTSDLLQSYRNNLEAIADVARNDPACFVQNTAGISYERIAAVIRDRCKFSLLIKDHSK